MIYGSESIDVRLRTTPVAYGPDCLPIDKTTYENFNKQNQSREVFDLWEMSLPNNQGWLGVVDSVGDVHIRGDFKTYIHQGSYQDLMSICKTIAREHPRVVEFYCVYLNSPLDVIESDQKTKIVFREEITE